MTQANKKGIAEVTIATMAVLAMAIFGPAVNGGLEKSNDGPKRNRHLLLDSHIITNPQGARLTVGTLQKQLFVDDYVVAERRNVTRELGEVKKVGLVLEPSLDTDFVPLKKSTVHGGPDEVLSRKPDGSRIALDFGFYTTVLWNDRDKKLQMWYMAWRHAGVGYAESKDGIHWTKPLVGKDGKNNIVHRGQGFSCMIDPTVPWGHPEKYKGAADLGEDGFGGQRSRVGLSYSPDGIHWTHYNRGKPVSHRAADFHNQILWDSIAGKYRLMTRTDLGAGGGAGESRSVRIMVHSGGNDLMQHPTAWDTIADEIAVDDPRKETVSWSSAVPRLQFNAMTCWIYEGVYFGLMDIYTMDRPGFFDGFDYDTRHEKDVMDFYIGASRDGANFDKSWVHARKPLVPRGQAGSFDKDGVKPPSQIVTYNDEHWIFYGGMSERHYSRGRDLKIGLAKLRLDGFVCLQAKDKPGVVVTRPFKLQGSTLLVNVGATDGEVLVEVLDAEGSPIPGFSASEGRTYEGVDELRLMPGWKSVRDLSGLKGKVIRLRFHLRNAKLYSFSFHD